MSHAIQNPLGAGGYTASKDLFPPHTENREVSAAVTALYVVAEGTNGKVAVAATNGTASLAFGVAMEAGSASGDTIRVATMGTVANVPAAGAIAAGDVVKRSATTAGYVSATATPGVGEALGYALAASASNVVTIRICKSL